VPRPVSDNLHAINTCDDAQVFISAAYSVPQSILSPVVMGNGKGNGSAMNSLYHLAHSGDEWAAWLRRGADLRGAVGRHVNICDALSLIFQLFARVLRSVSEISQVS
jgi:hypothetical protein